MGQQVYNEFQWSDSDQSEIDFELCVKPVANEDGKGQASVNSGAPKKNKIKYLKIKSGNMAKKIRINISDLSNTYLDKVKRLENYKKFLKMIGRMVEKGNHLTFWKTMQDVLLYFSVSDHVGLKEGSAGLGVFTCFVIFQMTALRS